MSAIDKLRQRSLIIILASAPAGLGHLRVTDALSAGLPEDVTPILLGSRDNLLTISHRITSVHPLARRLFEWIQTAQVERIFSQIYRFIIRHNTTKLYEQMQTILMQRLVVPKDVLIVATHFGLAHQLAAIKESLSRKNGIRLKLLVQVTDDTAMSIWYIDGADLIVVPSEQLKNKLISIGKRLGLKETPIIMSPYPLLPLLTEPLPSYSSRLIQTEKESKATIHIAVPISGAAVGTNFISSLITELHRLQPRTFFHIVVKTSSYTQSFREYMSQYHYNKIYTAYHDREVVDLYKKLYQKETIALEITKPSEHAFKCIADPHLRGGAIMLFTEPVGLQERDNLYFLRRHELIPNKEEQNRLFNLARSNSIIALDSDLLQKVRRLRGLYLPTNPSEAAKFISWCHNQHIFRHMMSFRKPHFPEDDPRNEELRIDGVKLFWEKAASLLE